MRLKEAIEDQFKYPSAQQEVIWRNAAIKEGSLESHGIEDGALLHLLIKLVGGGTGPASDLVSYPQAGPAPAGVLPSLDTSAVALGTVSITPSSTNNLKDMSLERVKELPQLQLMSAFFNLNLSDEFRTAVGSELSVRLQEGGGTIVLHSMAAALSPSPASPRLGLGPSMVSFLQISETDCPPFLDHEMDASSTLQDVRRRNLTFLPLYSSHSFRHHRRSRRCSSTSSSQAPTLR